MEFFGFWAFGYAGSGRLSPGHFQRPPAALKSGVVAVCIIVRSGRPGRVVEQAVGGGGRNQPREACLTVLNRDDDNYWRGLLYVNREDPALFVPKRVGIGWAVNFGNPYSWLVLVGLVVVVAGLVTLGALSS